MFNKDTLEYHYFVIRCSPIIKSLRDVCGRVCCATKSIRGSWMYPRLHNTNWTDHLKWPVMVFKLIMEEERHGLCITFCWKNSFHLIRKVFKVCSLFDQYYFSQIYILSCVYSKFEMGHRLSPLLLPVVKMRVHVSLFDAESFIFVILLQNDTCTSIVAFEY